MRLVIDCFKLVKGQGKSIGIYNLAKNLTRHLAQTNLNREHCEEIVVLGNALNRKDFEVPGVRFVLVKEIPQTGSSIRSGSSSVSLMRSKGKAETGCCFPEATVRCFTRERM